ncbi:MAG TPA: hypothetical protein DIU39_01745 [Flavobacteriales bacterium]|nr:hypothetical protein [Flavobacteriales bacterium]
MKTNKYIRLLIFIIVITAIRTIYESNILSKKTKSIKFEESKKTNRDKFIYSNNIFAITLPKQAKVEKQNVIQNGVNINFETLKIKKDSFEILISTVTYPVEFDMSRKNVLESALKNTINKYNYYLESKKDTLINGTFSILSSLNSEKMRHEVLLSGKGNKIILIILSASNKEILRINKRKYLNSLKFCNTPKN